MSIFDTLSQKMNELIPQFVQTKPAPQAGKALESARKLGEEIQTKITKPIVEKAQEKYFPTIINVFENISRAAGMLYGGFRTTDEAQLLKPISEIFGPKPKAKTITEALEGKPYLMEEVAKATGEIPVVGKIPGFPLVAGLIGEILLPPYFGKAANFVDDLAKINSKSATKNLLIKGVKNISESEADTLASKLAPITDKKVIQTELDTFAKSKADLAQISPKIAQKPLPTDEVINEMNKLIELRLSPTPWAYRAEPKIQKLLNKYDFERLQKQLPTPERLPIPEAQTTIQKLIKVIDEAIPLNAEQRKLYSQEMAKRTARVAAMGEKVAGEKGFYAQLGQLKGELPKKQFEAIRKQFTQKETDLLFDTIEQTKTLLPLEKVGTKEGLMKLFEGAVPTKGEIASLREVFPKELIDAILARRPILERMAELGLELTNVPRTMMATTDLSFGFRQGIFMLGRPKLFFSAFKKQFNYFASEKAYQGLIESIKSRPTYLKMKQGGLALTELGGPLLKREEAFMGSLAEKIPLYGRMVRASNRAYTGFANKLRADIFDDLLKKAQIVGKEIDNGFLKSLADFINAGTGRGKFGLQYTGILPKSLEKAAPMMNASFFSPRLMASRLNLLNPYFYIQLDPFVRKETLKTLFADAGIFATLYGLWKINGGDVGLDSRSADFGKIKIGNTRYDVLGGFQQYIKLASQLITGEITSSTTGRTITLGEGYKPLTRKDIILRFFENKTSPIASFVIGFLTGTTSVGEDFDVPAEIINRFTPMVVQDIYDISQEKGAEGILYGLPAIFGVGMQTYGKQELVFGESRLGEPTAQIRPVPELAEKIRELVLGQLPLGTSKRFSVETYFDQLSNLPREESADIFDKIAESNPELAKKLADIVKERELGITVKDKDLKSKGVTSGDRALAIKKEFDKLKTKEEKAALWDDYVKKGIITKDVSKQLLKLLNQ